MKIITEIDFNTDKGILVYVTKDFTSEQIFTSSLDLNTLSHNRKFVYLVNNYYKSMELPATLLTTGDLCIINENDRDKCLMRTTIVDYTKNETYLFEKNVSSNYLQKLLQLKSHTREVLIYINEIYQDFTGEIIQ